MLVRVVVVAMISNICSVQSQSLFSTQDALTSDTKKQQINNISKDLLLEIVDFWLKFGPDQQFGGFYGGINGQGQPNYDKEKTIVAQSRHLFGTSFLYYHLKNGLLRDLDGTIDVNEVEEQMENLFQFVIDSFVRSDSAEFPFAVSRDGKQVIDSDKRMYYTCFGIFGLAWYAKATNNNENRNIAVSIAIRAFNSVDNRLHDPQFLGYDQSREGNWLMPFASKGFNSHMHLLEALVPLYEVSSDQQVLNRTLEMIDVFMQHLVGSGNFCGIQYGRDWSIVSGDSVEYGHDLEGMVILLEAAETLPPPTLRYPLVLVAAKALSVIQHSIDYGYDQQFGGFFKLGKGNTYVIKDTKKEWWIQMEGCLGLYEGYVLSSNSQYLDYLIDTLNFVKQNLQSQFGGLYQQSDESGNVLNFDLGNQYKASYHNLRALVTLFSRTTNQK